MRAVERPGEAQGSRWTAAVNPKRRPRSRAPQQERWCEADRNGMPGPRHATACGSGGWPPWTRQRATGPSRSPGRRTPRNALSVPTQRRGARWGPLACDESEPALCQRFRRYRAPDGETTAERAVRQKGRSSSGSLRPGGRGDDGGAGRGPGAGIPGPAPISGPAREPSMTNSCTTMSVQYRVPPRSS